MTISSLTNRVDYPGTGTTGPFAFPFRILAWADLRVIRISETGVETVLTYLTDYTISGIGNLAGTVTLTVALEPEETLVLRRSPSLVQPTSVQNQTSYFAKTHEDEFDRLVMQLQELRDRIDRSAMVVEGLDPADLSMLVRPETGKILGWLSSTELGNLTPDATATNLPGENRTTTTLTTYLLNDRVYNVLDYGAVGDGIINDAAAIALAVANVPAAGGVLYFPKGTYKIATNTTISRKCEIVLAPGAVLAPANVYVRIQGKITAGRWQIFNYSGTGYVDFRDWTQSAGFEFSNANDTAYPEWWGAAVGDGGAGATDCSPPVQLAVKSGARRILFGEGFYKFLSSVIIEDVPTCPGDIVIEGISRTATYLMAGQSVLDATYNAMFRNKQDNGKLSFRNLRFHGQGGISNFTGYFIYAPEGVGGHQAIFSGQITNLWVSGSPAGGGFFYGALNNYLVQGCVWEGMRTRFRLTSSVAANADIQFVDNVDYANIEPFLDATDDTKRKNVITIRGLHSYQQNGGGPLIRATNCHALTISDVTTQVADDTLVGSDKGVLDLTDCFALNVSNIKVERFWDDGAIVEDYDTVFKLNGCTGVFSNCWVDGGIVQLDLRGALDLAFHNCHFINAQTFGIKYTAASTGRVAFYGSRFQYSGSVLMQHNSGTQTGALLFHDCDLLDGQYGAGVAGFSIDLGTAEEVRFVGCRIGRTTEVSGIVAWAAVTAYVVNDIKSNGGNNYRCIRAHTSSAAGAAGNEPGVGATWTSYWKLHTSNLTSIFRLSGTGRVVMSASGPFVGTATIITGASTQSFSQVSPGTFVGNTTWDPGNLADGAGESKDVTVAGAKLGDLAIAGFSLDTQGMLLSAVVKAVDTVTVRLQNETGGALDLASGTLKATVFRL